MNLIGRVFCFWTVVGTADRGKRKYWRCKCTCGIDREVLQYALTSGKSKSCGCRNGIDLTGRRFGHLLAVSPTIRADGVRVWRCKCDCGNDQALIRTNSLVEGVTTSCGCFGLEKRKQVLKDSKKSKCPFCAEQAAKRNMTVGEFHKLIYALR